MYTIADRLKGLHHKSRNSSNRFDPYRNPYERLNYHNKAGDTMKKVRVEVPNFAGTIDPHVFSDWLASLESHFEGYDMSDESRVSFAIMKFIGQAQIWWRDVEYDCQCARQPPIVRCDDMKQQLKQKYLPCGYEDELFEKFTTLRQGNMSVVECMNKFEGLNIWYRGIEDPQQILAQFKSGLRAEIRSRIIKKRTHTVAKAFQLALKIEKRLKQPLTGRFSSQAKKTPLGEVDLRASTMQPNYKVHTDYKVNTAIESKDKTTLADDPLELEEGMSHLLVVGRILATPNQDEDWKHTSKFQTMVRCGIEAWMLIIDGGSDINVVSETTVERLKLPMEPHPKPYKVAWINSTSILVTKQCLVPISHGRYNDSIWCDVIPMTHILLGCPWLYDQDVYHSEKNNKCQFMFNNETIVLKPMSSGQMKRKQEVMPKDVAESQKNLENIAETQKQRAIQPQKEVEELEYDADKLEKFAKKVEQPDKQLVDPNQQVQQSDQHATKSMEPEEQAEESN